jgi:outer membrane protein OmpA-like peptidoglycan-associated protein
MRKVSMLLMMSGLLAATSGCATKNFVRTSVKTSADQLSARIDTNESEIKELRDDTDKKVAGVDSKVTALDAKTTQQVNALKTDIQSADQHASQAQGAATQAQSSADRAATGLTSLDGRFQNRNQYNTSDEKAVQFKFGSATLDKQYTDLLDEVASALMQNPNAIVVLEGRTDSTGAKDFNVKLGERRIDAVRHYLVVEKGVQVYKIHEISFGSEKPVAENNTKEGREKNRAVVMTVMIPKSEGAVASRND